MAEDNDLPSYTRTSEQSVSSPTRRDSGAREPVEHTDSLFSSNGRPWVTLHLISNAPAGSKFPMYYSGDAVRGTAELILDGPHTIHSVVAEVRLFHAVSTLN